MDIVPKGAIYRVMRRCFPVCLFAACFLMAVSNGRLRARCNTLAALLDPTQALYNTTMNFHELHGLVNAHLTRGAALSLPRMYQKLVILLLLLESF